MLLYADKKKKIAIATLSCLVLFGCNKAHHTFGIHAPGTHTSVPGCDDMLTCNPVENVSAEATEFAVCTTEGHTVRFSCKEGNWTAEATENLPTGFSNVVTLPIDFSDEISIESIAKSTPEFQKRHVHVNFRPSCSDSKRHVYIGKIGLNGGGPSASSIKGDDPISRYINMPALSAVVDNAEARQAIATIAERCADDWAARDLWLWDKERYNWGKNTAKCNLFVAEVIANVGIAVRARRGGLLTGLTFRVPTAADWADDRVMHWSVVDRYQVEPGDVVAQRDDHFTDATGHVGIVVGHKTTASSASVGNRSTAGRIICNDWGFRSEQINNGTMRFLRCRAAGNTLPDGFLME